jgi:nucleotide-binding universal stress UspA family protein
LRPLPREAFEEDAEAISRGALEAVREDADGLQIDAIIREGHPAQVPLDEAKSADLLVVGSRGLGGFAELLLGLVSHECAQHATCPVVICIVPRTPSKPSARALEFLQPARSH